jgi:hypothetical protein
MPDKVRQPRERLHTNPRGAYFSGLTAFINYFRQTSLRARARARALPQGLRRTALFGAPTYRTKPVLRRIDNFTPLANSWWTRKTGSSRWARRRWERWGFGSVRGLPLASGTARVEQAESLAAAIRCFGTDTPSISPGYTPHLASCGSTSSRVGVFSNLHSAHIASERCQAAWGWVAERPTFVGSSAIQTNVCDALRRRAARQCNHVSTRELRRIHR